MPDWLETTLQDAVIGALTELAKLAVSPYSRTWLPVLAVSVLAAVWVARRGRATGRACPDARSGCQPHVGPVTLPRLQRPPEEHPG